MPSPIERLDAVEAQMATVASQVSSFASQESAAPKGWGHFPGFEPGWATELKGWVGDEPTLPTKEAAEKSPQAPKGWGYFPGFEPGWASTPESPKPPRSDLAGMPEPPRLPTPEPRNFAGTPPPRPREESAPLATSLPGYQSQSLPVSQERGTATSGRGSREIELLEKIVNLLERIAAQPQSRSSPRSFSGAFMEWARSNQPRIPVPDLENEETFPGASPSMNVSNLDGSDGAGGWGNGSAFRRMQNLQASSDHLSFSRGGNNNFVERGIKKGK